ncbi:MAG: ribbon-helix-helix protein, CopG family [Candidatus Bathyarchaeia archaeon]
MARGNGQQNLGKYIIVKVLLSRQQKEILEEIARKLGISESETMRKAFMDYAEKLNLVKEKIHS